VVLTSRSEAALQYAGVVSALVQRQVGELVPNGGVDGTGFDEDYVDPVDDELSSRLSERAPSACLEAA
jgi:hypothetical protein